MQKTGSSFLRRRGSPQDCRDDDDGDDDDDDDDNELCW
jgi:hypothetical protein